MKIYIAVLIGVIFLSCDTGAHISRNYFIGNWTISKVENCSIYNGKTTAVLVSENQGEIIFQDDSSGAVINHNDLFNLCCPDSIFAETPFHWNFKKNHLILNIVTIGTADFIIDDFSNSEFEITIGGISNEQVTYFRRALLSRMNN